MKRFIAAALLSAAVATPALAMDPPPTYAYMMPSPSPSVIDSMPAASATPPSTEPGRPCACTISLYTYDAMARLVNTETLDYTTYIDVDDQCEDLNENKTMTIGGRLVPILTVSCQADN